MRRVGQVRRRDSNEKGITAALRAVGADVTPISGEGAPDLLIRFRGLVYAVEVKTATGARTAAQQVSQWPVVRSVDEAFALLGIIPKESSCD